MKKGINNGIEIYQNFDFHFCIQENTCLCSECFNGWGKARFVRTYIYRASAFSIASSDIFRCVGVRLQCNYWIERSRGGLPLGIPVAYKVTFEAAINIQRKIGWSYSLDSRISCNAWDYWASTSTLLPSSYPCVVWARQSTSTLGGWQCKYSEFITR